MSSGNELMRQTWPAEQSLARVTRHRVESTYGDHLKEMSLGSSQYPSTIYVGYRPGSFKSPYGLPGVRHDAKMFMAAQGITSGEQWHEAYNVIDPALDVKASSLVRAWSLNPSINFSVETCSDEALNQACESAMTVALGNAGYKASMAIKIFETDDEYDNALRMAKKCCGEVGVRDRMSDTYETLTRVPERREGYLKAVGLSTLDGENFAIDDPVKAMSVGPDGYLIFPQGTSQKSEAPEGEQQGEGWLNTLGWVAQSILGLPEEDSSA